MSARYLIRLDDACAQMDAERWRGVEGLLDEFNCKPIVAVVPDNQDSGLKRQSTDVGFWEKVRGWQSKGWTIAMHGHTHVMHDTNEPLLVPYYRRSEFAGLSFQEQSAKIRSAWNIFLSQAVEPVVWVAPAHSFNSCTLRALREETSIRMVSDGIAWDTFFDGAFQWIPQQMWTFSRRMSGLWTVCLHPNDIEEKSMASLRRNLAEYQRQIISVRDVPLTRRGKSIVGHLYDYLFWFRWRRSNPPALMDSHV